MGNTVGGGDGGGFGGGGGGGGGGTKVWGAARVRRRQMTFEPRVERSGARGGVWESDDSTYD